MGQSELKQVVCDDQTCTLQPYFQVGGGISPQEELYTVPLKSASVKQATKRKRRSVKKKPYKQVGGGKAKRSVKKRRKKPLKRLKKPSRKTKKIKKGRRKKKNGNAF